MPGKGRQGSSPRGFAAMSPAKRREIARKGGQASHGRRSGDTRSGSVRQQAKGGRQGRRQR